MILRQAAGRTEQPTAVAGVVVQVEDGPRLRTWQGFYEWAHGRYHMLEDGHDKWIGNDQA
jgi:hypothetical protein